MASYIHVSIKRFPSFFVKLVWLDLSQFIQVVYWVPMIRMS